MLCRQPVPCLRRAASLQYTDADEDAERLVTADGTAGGDGDEWVETHAGRKPSHGANAPGEIEDIPDADEEHDGGATSAMAALSLSGSNAPADIPDMDEIPDMEEDLEGGEDEATAAPAKPAVVTKDAYVTYFSLSSEVMTSWLQRGRRFKRELASSTNLRCHDHLR